MCNLQGLQILTFGSNCLSGWSFDQLDLIIVLPPPEHRSSAKLHVFHSALTT